jgi:ankyrin repeat protein
MGCLTQLLASDPSLALAEDDEQEKTPLHCIKHDAEHRCYAFTAALLAAAAAAAAVAAVAEPLDNQLLYSTYSYVSDARVCHPCLRALVAAGALPDAENEEDEKTFVHLILQTTALHEGTAEQLAAAVAESTETVLQLIAAGMELYEGQLLSICDWDHGIGVALNPARVLLACGADVHHSREHNDSTALHSAAKHYRNPELMQLLIDAGAELEARDNDGCTALIHAARYGDTANAQKLLQLGAVYDVQDSTGLTPLLAACQNPEGCGALVQQLLSLGADAKQRDSSYANASVVHEDGQRQAIHVAAASYEQDSDDMTLIDSLLQNGASLADTTSRGCTPLWLMVRHGAYSKYTCDRIDWLLERGASLQHSSSSSCGTLLHAAASSGSIAVMQLLLDNGLSLSDESCTSAGYTPLLLAAAAGHTDMLQLMITAGCNVDAKLKDGSTALTLCLQRKLHGVEEDNCCKMLIDAGCSVSTMMGGRSVYD